MAGPELVPTVNVPFPVCDQPLIVGKLREDDLAKRFCRPVAERAADHCRSASIE